VIDPRVHASAGSVSRPPQAAAGWLAVVAAAVTLTIACQRSVPGVDTVPQLSPSAGTISGTVRGLDAALPADNRIVEVVNVDTGETRRVTTNHTGEFRCRLRPGKYRVALTLRAGESVVRQPGVIDLQRTGRGVQADIVLGTSPVPRPRAPAYRTDDGLGSPIA
jgi:hypothetical protein